MHGDNGVSTPMAETLSQRSTQNTCSSYLRPNQHDGDTVHTAGFKATSWPHTPTGQYHAYPAPKHTKQLSCTPRSHVHPALLAFESHPYTPSGSRRMAFHIQGN